MLRHTACGFGHVALLGLLDSVSRAANPIEANPNPRAPRPSHFAPRAKNVIFFFLHGGVSHIDSFDPKPKLDQLDGTPLPF